MARKRTDVVKLQLRLLEGLRRRLEHAAADNKRSMNTEIIARLDASFEQPMLTELMRNALRGVLLDYFIPTKGPLVPPAPGGALGGVGQPKTEKDPA